MKKFLIPIILFFCANVAQAYTVQPGDTLSKIAIKNNTTWQELWGKNPQIKNPNFIYVGQEIAIFDEMLGSTLPIAGMTYNLAGSGITSSAASLTLQSLTIPQNSYKIVDSDLSDTFYLTLEPGSRSKQEIISCTTVVQNESGTATISGCVRGLSPVTPYTASTTLQFAHGGGSQVIFSDPPQLFNQYPAKDNASNISGAWNFQTAPTSSDQCISSNEYCTKTYIDNSVNQGAATSTEDDAGIGELATAKESASSTPFDINNPHFQNSEDATSTPNPTANPGLWDVWTENDGKINQNFLDLSENTTWTGSNQFTGTRNTTTNAILPHATTSDMDFTGNIYRNGNIWNPIALASTTPTSTKVTGESQTATLESYTIPANAIGTSGLIKLEFWGTGVDPATGNTYNVLYGGQTACTLNTGSNWPFYYVCYIMAWGTNKQTAFGMSNKLSTGDGTWLQPINTTVDSTQSQTLIIQAITSTGATAEANIRNAILWYGK